MHTGRKFGNGCAIQYSRFILRGANSARRCGLADFDCADTCVLQLERFAGITVISLTWASRMVCR